MFNPAEALRDNPTLFACYILFVYFRGKNAVRIEREMRALGYSSFHRRNLYPRGHQPGWIARHRWSDLLAVESPVVDERQETRDKSHLTDRSPVSGLPSSDFHKWLKRVSPNMTWDWKHQQVIIEQLKKVTSGDCRRLMIFLPPRHGKSELVSVRYTAWRMQQDPSMNVILGSYNQRLADRMSRKIRTVVCDAEALRLGKTQRPVSVPRAVAGGSTLPIETPGNEIDAANDSQEGRLASALSSTETSGGKPAFRTETGSEDRSSEPPDIPQSALRTPQSPFPFSRPRPKNAVSEWETASGGSFRAVGSGSGVTGFGANLIVIDDPVKNRAQAESETFRNRVWDWYKDDLYTRLEPDGSIVLIQTRWHEDDLAGRLLQENLDDWTIINLPALSEPKASATGRPSEPPASAGGRFADTDEPQMDADQRKYMSVPPASAGGCSQPSDTPSTPIDPTDLSQEGRFTPAPESTQPSGGKPAFPTETDDIDSEDPHSAVRSPQSFDWRHTPNIALCPERFDVNALDKLKTQLGTYSFSALYQQRPTPAGGEIFKREWFKNIIDFAPPGLRWTRGYDLAVSTKTDGDYTASFRVAFDKKGNLYISGGFRRRIEFPEQRRYIIDRITHERDTEHGIELALHGQALIQELRRDPALRGRSFRGVKVSTDKQTRANSWSPLAEEGKVILVRSSTGNGEPNASTSRSKEGRFPPARSAHGLSGGKPAFRTETDCLDTEISPRTGPLIHRSETVHSPLSTVSWINDLLDELTAFPNGSHDDQIDAISIAVQMHATKPNRAVGMLIT